MDGVLAQTSSILPLMLAPASVFMLLSVEYSAITEMTVSPVIASATSVMWARDISIGFDIGPR